MIWNGVEMDSKRWEMELAGERINQKLWSSIDATFAVVKT